MLRVKFILFAMVIVSLVFISIINYLLFDLNISQSEVINTHSIKELIYQKLHKLPDYYKKRNLLTTDNNIEIFLTHYNKPININNIKNNYKKIWKGINAAVTNGQLFNVQQNNLGEVFYAMQNAKIIKSDIDSRGTQLKLLLTLEGDQLAVFKPKWYDKEHIIEGPVYAGKDRYGAEIVGFYLSIILNKFLTPISVERVISIKNDILPTATKRLKDTIFVKNNRTCLYGKCHYCRKEDPICDDTNDNLKGALIFNVNVNLKLFRSPWQRTYKANKKAVWEATANFCKYVKQKLTPKRIYDLTDTAIFDFLLQNGDRHHYETFSNNVVWLDNGKGLGNPNVHHIDILAPLYQCCMIKKDTLKILLGLSGGKLKEQLRSAPNISNFITDSHLNAIEERLLIIFATYEYCKSRRNNVDYFYLIYE